MPKLLPFAHNPNAARARRARTMLLPMPRTIADEIALRVHLALAAMRAGAGSRHDAQTLTQTMILMGFIAEAAFGPVTYEQLAAAEAAISAASDRGRDTGEWRLDGEAADLFAAIVTTYDGQLRRAPLWAIAEASERLDRFRAGEAYQRADRKLG
ncbi:hypothetical protein [Paraburkholderia domus]|uniref:hypothetical protein n=1 Tax=Paraburkholderia domus TaxID=2793075 RepID=UPI00191470E2|nr:hypothetical protein [Paraburkholderia domus]MBK5064752.1 hypothetical protein [Burkholderia sp. R-70199]CAE6955851.1 hypothetical protein R70199_06942 [Paraburkholderia domus]